MATRQQMSRQGYSGSQLALENDPRFAVPAGGATGQVLAKTGAASYATGWTTPASGGGGLTPTAAQTGNYQAVKGDLVLCDASGGGGFTVTAPAAPARGDTFAVKKVDTSGAVVTVVTGSSATIDGDTSCTLAAQDAAATFVYDGAATPAWQIASTAVTGAAASGTSSSGSADGLLAPAYTSGYWYDRRSGTPSVPAATGSAGYGVGTYFVSQYLHKSVTIQSVALVTGSTVPTSGAAVRLGAYSADGTNGLPKTLLNDLGLLSLPATASAVATLTLGTAVTLSKGFIWWALAPNGTNMGSIVVLTQANNPLAPTQGWDNTSFTASNAGGSAHAYYVYIPATNNSAALPATVTPTVLQSSNSPTANVYFRIA